MANKKTSMANVKEVNKKCKAFLSDKKNSNCIIDIIVHAETEDDAVLSACIRAFHKIFIPLIKNHEVANSRPEVSPQNDLSVEMKLKVWLNERYDEAIGRLLELLQHSSSTVQELALCTLMKFVQAESKASVGTKSQKAVNFPVKLIEKIIVSLLSKDVDVTQLNARFQEYLEYDDVRYFTLRTMSLVLKETADNQNKDVFLNNCFALLENLSMPASTEENLTNLMSELTESDAKVKMVQVKEHKKLFSSNWLTFLRFKLSVSLYKKTLMILHEKVMPHLANPLILSDFLTESYNIGGAISLLSLNGLFILVHKYNLNYPDFYKKLYMLLEPSVFHVKYKARFFFLADLFLTSTHLPAYLVAAFAKKLSRLALTAPPSGLTLILPFIYNLINRHPNCKALLHRENADTDMKDDPFKIDEADPSKCCALESSLWEIKTLQSHYYHAVATLAMKIENPLPNKENDLSDLLETTEFDLFEKETQKPGTDFPLTFDPPQGLFTHKHDKMADIWILK